ncbi:MAG: tetratricopeptide repeat protein [Alphaproteobacteria bacterium]
MRMRGVGFAGALLAIGISGCASTGDTAFDAAVSAFRKGDIAVAHKQASAANQAEPGTKKFLALLTWTTLKQGDLAGAEKLLKELQKLDPSYVETTQLTAWVAYSKGDMKAAEEAFASELAWSRVHKTRRYYPNKYTLKDVTFIENIYADGHNGLAMTALAKGDSASALEHLNAAMDVTSYGGHDDMVIAAADILAKQGKHKAALEALEKLPVDKATLATYPIYLRVLLLSGATAQAATLAGQASSKYPTSAYYPLVEAVALAADNKIPEANGKADKAMTMAANYAAPDLLYSAASAMPAVRQWADQTGQRYYDRGAYSAARLFFGATWKKEDCRARLMTAWSDHYGGSVYYARDEFQSIAADGCKPPEEALTGQGAAELALGRTDEAEKLFRRAQEANPGYVRARVALGGVAYLRGRYAEAARIYGENLAGLPAGEPVWSWGSHALNNYGWALYYTKDYQKASDIFQKLERYHGPTLDPSGLAGYGWSAYQLGQRDTAKSAFVQSLALAPGYRLALSGLEQLKSGGASAK